MLVSHWILKGVIAQVLVECRFLGLCETLASHWGNDWSAPLCVWNQNCHGRPMFWVLMLVEIWSSLWYALLFLPVHAVLSWQLLYQFLTYVIGSGVPCPGALVVLTFWRYPGRCLPIVSVGCGWLHHLVLSLSSVFLVMVGFLVPLWSGVCQV